MYKKNLTLARDDESAYAVIENGWIIAKSLRQHQTGPVAQYTYTGDMRRDKDVGGGGWRWYVLMSDIQSTRRRHTGRRRSRSSRRSSGWGREEIQQMQRQIERYLTGLIAPRWGGQIVEEARSSAHRWAAAGVAPASHNTRLPWRQACLHIHTDTHTQTHTNKRYMHPAAHAARCRLLLQRRPVLWQHKLILDKKNMVHWLARGGLV